MLSWGRKLYCFSLTNSFIFLSLQSIHLGSNICIFWICSSVKIQVRLPNTPAFCRKKCGTTVPVFNKKSINVVMLHLCYTFGGKWYSFCNIIFVLTRFTEFRKNVLCKNTCAWKTGVRLTCSKSPCDLEWTWRLISSSPQDPLENQSLLRRKWCLIRHIFQCRNIHIHTYIHRNQY